MTLSIHKAGHTVPVNTFLFPGGEVGVKVDVPYFPLPAKYQTIIARLQDANDIMGLVMTTDALRRIDATPIRLFMPYVPYGRQDRVCSKGESFSLKAFAGIINSLNFESVTVVDPHSDVTGAVFNNIRIITQLEVINKFQPFLAFMTPAKGLLDIPVFVSPDAGANKKTAELAKYFGHPSFIRADKLREMETGKIKETVVYADKAELEGRTVIIADDICDGGKTFIELAKVLKGKGVAKVALYVTHGIFSKGPGALLGEGIDEIFTTNAYKTSTGSLTALNLEEAFQL